MSSKATEMQKLVIWIIKITVASLASIMISVVVAMIIGLFMPNELIDNKDIFAMISPAFNTVVGAFVGLLGGMSLTEAARPTNENTDTDTENL